MLLDEPYSALDPVLREELRVEVADLIRGAGVGAVHVTHDPDEALTVADKIAVMDAGRIVQFGGAADVYRNPSSLAAARAFGRVALLDTHAESGYATAGGVRWPIRDAALRGPVTLAIRHDELTVAPDGAEAEIVGAYAARDRRYVRVRLTEGEVVIAHDGELGARMRVAPGRTASRQFAR